MNLTPSPHYPRFPMGRPLTKIVQGQKAYADEEILARALDRRERNYLFQWIVPAYDGAPIANLAGEVHIDFLDVTDSVLHAIWADDITFVHKGAEQQEKDRRDEIRVSNYFAANGYQIILHRIPATKLETDEQATAAVNELYTGQIVTLDSSGVDTLFPTESTPGVQTIQAPPEGAGVVYSYTLPPPRITPEITISPLPEERPMTPEERLAFDALVAKVTLQEERLQTQQNLLDGIFRQGGPSIVRLSDITSDAGEIRAGKFLALSTGVEPNMPDATGAFLSALGEVLAAGTFHVGAVKNGVLSAGFNIDGDFIAGLSTVKINELGVTIDSGAVPQINFVLPGTSYGIASISGDEYDDLVIMTEYYGKNVWIQSSNVDGCIDLVIKLTGGETPYLEYREDDLDATKGLLEIAHILKFLNKSERVDEFSSDVTMAGNSDTAVPTEKAVKTYIAAHGGYTQGARVYNSAKQNTSNGATTTLTFNSERYDTDTMHDTVTNNSRITFTTAGRYSVGGFIQFDPASLGIRVISVKYSVTAATIGAQYALNTGAYGNMMTVNCIYDFAAGDYIELQSFQNCTVDLLVQAEFWAQRVG